MVDLSPRWRNILKTGFILLSLGLVGLGMYALKDSLKGVSLSGLKSLWARLPVEFWGIWIGLNLAVILVWAWRWSVILQPLGIQASLKNRVFARLAGFGWSYFTPGPQVGGEPVQVYLISRYARVPVPLAATSVYLERVVDGLTNFAVLLLGVMTMLFLDVEWMGGIRWFGVVTGGLLIIPALHLMLLKKGRLPLTAAVMAFSGRWGTFGKKVLLQVSLAESYLSNFAQQYFFALVKAFLLSIFVWLLTVLEFSWLLSGLSESLSPLQVLRFLVLARLSFLLPIPAATGVFESAMVFAAVSLGLPPLSGIALGLTIRLRDVLLALIGVFISGGSAMTRRFDSQDLKREVVE